MSGFTTLVKKQGGTAHAAVRPRGPRLSWSVLRRLAYRETLTSSIRPWAMYNERLGHFCGEETTHDTNGRESSNTRDAAGTH